MEYVHIIDAINTVHGSRPKDLNGPFVTNLVLSLDLYKGRGEFDGTVESAIACLTQAGYEYQAPTEALREKIEKQPGVGLILLDSRVAVEGREYPLEGEIALFRTVGEKWVRYRKVYPCGDCYYHDTRIEDGKETREVTDALVRRDCWSQSCFVEDLDESERSYEETVEKLRAYNEDALTEFIRIVKV